ncbi:MAG: TPM domain-containing protein [Burkholderiales bacterium]
MNVGRWLRHLVSGPLSVSAAFPAAAMAAIEAEIRATEATHLGEIVFAVQGALDGQRLMRGISARERAIEVFSELRVWDTEHRNGVLIYLLLADRDVEIVADRGIHRPCGAEAWEEICHAMEEEFRAGRFEAGAIRGIREIGAHLTRHFPGDGTRSNELSDRPVVL